MINRLSRNLKLIKEKNLPYDKVLYNRMVNTKKNLPFDEVLYNRKKKLAKRIYKIFSGKIQYGRYASTKIDRSKVQKNRFGSCLSSKLLGLYEEQVQDKIIELKKKYKLETIINFGAEEGYHIVGLIKNSYFKRGLAFERDPLIKKNLRKNIKINNLSKKIDIYGKASSKQINDCLNKNELTKTLFLVDIEGGEFDIFNKNNIQTFKNSVLVIENHDFMTKNKKKIKKFTQLIRKNFNIEILKNTTRNPFISKKLSMINDNDRWLAVIEGRACEMNWIICKPKTKQN
tara:strand:+ start:166 stop:1026 length:861 start_codon:yes stop_codon:yes gene_type:complete